MWCATGTGSCIYAVLRVLASKLVEGRATEDMTLSGHTCIIRPSGVSTRVCSDVNDVRPPGGLGTASTGMWSRVRSSGRLGWMLELWNTVTADGLESGKDIEGHIATKQKTIVRGQEPHCFVHILFCHTGTL